MPTQLTLEGLSNQFGGDLEDSSTNNDDSRGLVSLLGSVLNAANCSLSPDCGSLHRYHCSSVDHTCGHCREGYFGDGLYANTACFAIGEGASYRRAQQLRASDSALRVWKACVADDGCGLWETCENNVCMSSPKACPGACSDRGACSYRSSIDNTLLNGTCSLGDSSCEAVCRCDAGYAGDSCSLTEAEMTLKREMRRQLISRMLSIVESDDVDETTLTSWVSSLRALSQIASELSRSAKAVLAERESSEAI